MSKFCLLMELHWEGSAPASWSAYSLQFIFKSLFWSLVFVWCIGKCGLVKWSVMGWLYLWLSEIIYCLHCGYTGCIVFYDITIHLYRYTALGIYWVCCVIWYYHTFTHIQCSVGFIASHYIKHQTTHFIIVELLTKHTTRTVPQMNIILKELLVLTMHYFTVFQ